MSGPMPGYGRGKNDERSRTIGANPPLGVAPFHGPTDRLGRPPAEDVETVEGRRCLPDDARLSLA